MNGVADGISTQQHHRGFADREDATSSASSRLSKSHAASWRNPLMKKVGVPFTPLRTPLRKSSRTRGACMWSASSR